MTDAVFRSITERCSTSTCRAAACAGKCSYNYDRIKRHALHSYMTMVVMALLTIHIVFSALRQLQHGDGPNNNDDDSNDHTTRLEATMTIISMSLTTSSKKRELTTRCKCYALRSTPQSVHQHPHKCAVRLLEVRRRSTNKCTSTPA